MFDSRKYRPENPELVEEFIRSQQHATLMAAAPGKAPQASILPFVVLDDGSIELHAVQADATFKAAAANPRVSLLIADFLAFTPHDWIDPVDGSESTLHFEAVLLHGTATLSREPGDVARALARLADQYGHGPDMRPIADDEHYGPQLRRLGVVTISVETVQAKFKVGMGDLEQRLDTAARLRQRDDPNDARAAEVIERIAPRLVQ